MRQRHHYNHELVIVTIMLTAVYVSGCSVESSQSGPPRVEAEIDYPSTIFSFEQRPDNSKTLVKVTQDNAPSGAFYGFENEDADQDAIITEFSADTSRQQDDFAVTVSNGIQSDRMLIGETELDLDYNQDGSINFSVNRGDEVLFSGLDVPRPEAKSASARYHKITEENVADCAEQLITQIADELMADVGGAAPEFVSCVLSEQIDVVLVAETVCVSASILVDALVIEEGECATTGGCPLQRLTPAMESAEFYSDVAAAVLEQTLAEVRGVAEMCPVATDPQTPVANAGSDQSTLGAGNLITLNGTATSDPNSDPLAFSWVQISGTPVDVLNEHSKSALFGAPSITDMLIFELTVTDVWGNSDSDTVSVSLQATDIPYAYAGTDQVVAASSEVTLDGTNSFAHDGNGLSYSWQQLEGLTVELAGADTATPMFTAPAGTEFTTVEYLKFQLRVEDTDGNTAFDKVNVTVTIHPSN